MIPKLAFLFLCVAIVILWRVEAHQLYVREHALEASDQLLTMALRRGPFIVREFRTARKVPLAVMTFGSGDGGWSSWEETVCHALETAGYTVIGIDSSRYARTDYDLATLQADFGKIARTVFASYPASSPPLIIGGWSMGAAQAIAAAGGPDRPPRLIGVVLASPLRRGRYGLRLIDRLDFLPKGPGTFAVADFASGLSGLRIVQWHGAGDMVDSRAWLARLKTPYREYIFPYDGHHYAQACPVFLRRFVGSVAWILKPPPALARP